MPQRKTTIKPGWYTHISQLEHSCFRQRHTKVKSGVSLRCASSILVRTSHYSRLKDRPYRLLPRKDYHVYIARSIHTHVRLKSIGKKNKEKKGKEYKRNEKKENKIERKRKRTKRKVKQKQDKTRKQ